MKHTKLFTFTLLLHHYYLTLLVVKSSSLSPQPNAFNDDVFGLIVFKAVLQDPDSKLQSWSEDDNTPCNWVGVQCDPSSNRVTHLTLDGFSLSGHIGRGLLRLQFLQVLSLSDNSFNGSINPDLFSLGGLQVVDFSGNRLSGSIPGAVFQECGSLRSLSFARNALNGNVPDALVSCSGLQVLNFSSNQLSGVLPSGLWSLKGIQSVDLSDNLFEGSIPLGIAGLYDLRVVNLQKNRLSEQIPADIGGCASLNLIDISENALSGSLPESLRGLNSCTSLRLGSNSLVGEVPAWIGELTNLESLDLSANNLLGRVPSSVGKLYKLKELNLSSNQLSGGLPQSIASCFSLSSIDISQNRFTGNLPSWIFAMGLRVLSLSRNRFSGTIQFPRGASSASLQGLQVLDLSSNALSGEIPSNIGLLSSLLLFNASSNQLVGSIPPNVQHMKTIQVVDLSDNRLNGSIPSEIGGAVSLTSLSLQKNFLSGSIPTEIGKCSFLTYLNVSFNRLSGPIPRSIANLSGIQYVDLSFNNLTGSIPKELTNLSHLGAFNVSRNNLQGELPVGGFFNTIPPSSVSGNPSLCGSVVNHSCPAVHPKPLVLNPNSSNSSKGSPFNYHHKKIMLSISALIAIVAAACIALGVVAVTILNIHVRSSMARHSPTALAFSGGEDFMSCSPSNDPKNYGKLVMFSGDAEFVAGAHALLNKDCEIGRGGFGVVYRTVLRDGRSVAIKKLTVSSLIKSQDDFEREVNTLGKIRHHNLVAIEGYYWTPSLQLLIYEYISSGSLHKHLHDSHCLSWQQRFNIILGMAKGLAFLHQTNTIHYNLKSTNILIDDSGDPKVGDFGLARLLPTLDRCVLSSKIQSALGYMAPEFACRTVKITKKCDVYGFGILVLEVVTGKRPVEYMEDDVVVLCDMVRGALENGTVEECVDERLQGHFAADVAIPVIKLGLICASQVPSNRPDMEEVVNILELIQSPVENQDQRSE